MANLGRPFPPVPLPSAPQSPTGKRTLFSDTALSIKKVYEVDPLICPQSTAR